MMHALVSNLSWKMFGEDVWLCYSLLSLGDTKSESNYHYCLDLGMKFLKEQDI